MMVIVSVVAIVVALLVGLFVAQAVVRPLRKVQGVLAALAAGDLHAARALAAEGRGAEGGPAAPLRHLTAFLDTVDDAYLAAAARLPEQVVVVGRLEHDELVGLLPACEAQVVPSTFPEAFGMVAAEAAACGSLPVVALHSGLGEVATTLSEVVPEAARPLLGFERGADAVPQLAAAVAGWLEAPEALRAATREAMVAVTRERYSWDGVARTVLAAAQGDLDGLPSP